MGGAQGIMGVAKQQSGSRSSLASAINSGLPTNSYGGLGGAGGGGTRMNHMTPFGSTCKWWVWSIIKSFLVYLVGKYAVI